MATRAPVDAPVPFVMVVMIAPRLQQILQHSVARQFVKGITAAAVGALLGAVVIMGTRSLVDGFTFFIACSTLLVLWWRPRMPEPAVILLAGAAGIIARAARKAAQPRLYGCWIRCIADGDHGAEDGFGAALL